MFPYETVGLSSCQTIDRIPSNQIWRTNCHFNDKTFHLILVVHLVVLQLSNIPSFMDMQNSHIMEQAVGSIYLFMETQNIQFNSILYCVKQVDWKSTLKFESLCKLCISMFGPWIWKKINEI